MREWNRVRSFLIFFIVALIITACEARVDVIIDVASDGSGEVEVLVTLDEVAAAKLPDLETELRLDDLVAADWDVSPIEVDEDVTTIRASKRFANPDQLQPVLDEITGPNGMFTNFTIEQSAEFAERRFDISGDVDLRRGLELFGDVELTDVLGGEMFGRPLDFYLDGDATDDALEVVVEVQLPGEGDGSSGSRATWTPRFDDTELTRVQLQSVDENFTARLLRWIGTAGFILFGLSVVLGLLAVLLDRRAKKKRGVAQPESVVGRVPWGRRSAARRQRGGRGARGQGGAQQQQPMPGPARQLRLVCLDPLGVLYNMGGDSVDLLVSFIRSRGSNVARSKIDELHTKASLGRMTSAEFWKAVEVEGAANDLDEAYIELIEPRNGASEFLREMRRREVPVTCLSNDLSAWSRRLRERDNLAMIWPWIISADVGVRKPDPGIFEALRRESGVPYEACLLIDTKADNLDAARTLGMSTAYFADQRPSPEGRPNHPVVTSFADFFRRRS